MHTSTKRFAIKYCVYIFLLVSEFDDYYMSLRPRMESDSCNISSQENIPHTTNTDLEVNCRNVWFREFWSQHNKCNFVPGDPSHCTAMETIKDYEQEGLVPFVGKLYYICNLFHVYYRFVILRIIQ